MKTHLVAISLCALVMATGCARSAPSESGDAPQANSSTATAEVSTGSSGEDASGPAPNVDALETSFSEMSSAIPADVGVAIADESGVRTFGSWKEGPAWSTIKTPLAIAALRHSQEEASSLVPLAIKESDNVAAERMWAQLGEPNVAADAVAAVLRDGGDTSTVVQSERTRKEFTAFGQTTWSMANQALFLKALPCISESGPVVTDMKNLAGNQQWGLAVFPEFAAKGGWGPSPEGAYLVRQVATASVANGHVGVALSALPQDGKFESGVAYVDKLAEWVQQHLGDFSPATCST